MRRGRKTTEATDGFSLFPFLAVLLCTMGALIVLLVVIAQMARAQAQEESVRVDADAEAARRQHVELLSTTAELEEQRRAAEAAAEEERQAVARLRSRLDELLAQLADAQRAVREQQPLVADEQSLDDARRQLAWFRRKIAETMQQLRDAERRAGEKSFAVVPYAGLNGTRRRPIYIECRKDRVVLQPSGIEFTEEDFALDQSGGPLETALRATLGYLERTGQSQVESPYPMLLVRPDGVAAYYAALDTVAELDLEYGYELVDGDWDLEFEPPDAQLAQLQAQAAYKARDVQRRLLAARGRSASRRSQAFHLGASGSLQAVDGDGFSREGDGGFASAADGPGDSGPARSFTAPGGDGGLGSEPDGTGHGPVGGGGQDAFAVESSQSRTPYGAPGIGSPTNGDDDGFTTLLGNGGEGRRGRGETGGGTTPGGNSQYAGPDGDDATGAGSGAMATDRRLNGGPGGGGEAGSAFASQGAGAAAQPGSAAGAADHAAGGAASINAGGGTQQAVARQRGFNWALPGARGKTTAIARPIDVALTGDALAILGRPRTPPRAVVRFRRDTAASVDELQRAVEKVIDGWGIAGGGMYWKPILRVQLAPDGVRRYHDLRALMQGSGIDLEAVAPPAAAGAYRPRSMR